MKLTTLKKRIFALFIIFSLLLPYAVFAIPVPDNTLAPSEYSTEEPEYDIYNNDEPQTNEEDEEEHLEFLEPAPLFNPITVYNFDELQDAIASSAVTGEDTIVINNHIDFTDTIYLTGIEITILAEGDWELRNANAGEFPAFVLGSGAVLNLGSEDWSGSLNGHLTITGFNPNNQRSPINVGSGTVLNLHDNVRIYGNTAARGGGVAVNSGGTFNMYGGIIANNNVGTSDANTGGGVFVDGGTFNMQSGTIADNHAGTGGGVYSTGDATFTMTGGRIENNNANGHKTSHETTNGYGGGVLVGGGIFNMHGGVIDSNRTTQTGQGGGVAVINEGIFNMSDSAEITNNEGRRMHGAPAGGNGSGVRVSSGATFNMSGDALIADNRHRGSQPSWGAVSVEGTFNMYDGTITRNLSANNNSNAIHFSGSGTFNMYGGVIESNGNVDDNGNQRSGANAVLIGDNNTFNMFDGLIRDQNGPAIHLTGTIAGSGVANLSGGRITENRASGVSMSSNARVNISGTAEIYNNTNAGDGGGIRLTGINGVITMTGGSIEGNTATGRGGGVSIAGENTTFDMYDGRIEDNRALGTFMSTQSQGGGVFIATAGATFNMLGDALFQPARIDNNHVANNGRGGGVFVNAGTFNMQGGIIQNHTITGNLSRGGGVAVESAGTFLLAEGIDSPHYLAEIRHNSVGGIGGGVFIDNGGTMRMNTSVIRNNFAGLDGGGIGLGIPYGDYTDILDRFSTVLSNITVADIGGAGASIHQNIAGNGTKVNRILEAHNPQVAPTSGEGFDNNDIHSFLPVSGIVELNVLNHKLASDELAGASSEIEIIEGEETTVSIYRHFDATENMQFREWIFADDYGNIFTPDYVSAETFVADRGWHTEFTMPMHNVTVTAVWDYWLTFSSNPEYAGIVTATVNGMPATSGMWVAEGSIVEITGLADALWYIDSVEYSGSIFEIYDSSMPTSVIGTAEMTEVSDFVVHFIEVPSPDVEITIEVDEDGQVTITTPDWVDDIDYARYADGTIVVVLPPETDHIIVIIPEEQGWTYEITVDGSGNFIVTISPPPLPPVDAEITTDEDENVIVIVPPGIDYDKNTDEDGNIIITFPPGQDLDEDNIIVNLPPEWDFQTDTDGDGNITVTITPPQPPPPPPPGDIEITTDEDGNVVITTPPGIDYDKSTDEDGNIIITFPPGQDLDEDNIIVSLPPDWEFEINTDDDGNINVTITPPQPPPPGDVEITTDEDGNVVITTPPGIDYDKSTDEDGNIIISFPPGQDLDEDNIIVNLPPDWDFDIDTDDDGNITVTITPPQDQGTGEPEPPTEEPESSTDDDNESWNALSQPISRPQTQPPTQTEAQIEAASGVHHAFIIGFEDQTIRPNGEATRAQLATIFFRLMSDSDRTRYWRQDNPFPDVRLDDWFNNAVSTTANAGIFMGMPDGTFQPNRTVTRAELTAAIIRFTNLRANYAGENKFSDITGHWAAGYINNAATSSLVTGYEGPGGRFMPDNAISRAEIAAITNRALRRLPESAYDLLPDMLTWPDNANPSAWYYLYIQEATNSHYYVRKADGIHETWDRLIPPRNWKILERPDSRPGDIFVTE